VPDIRLIYFSAANAGMSYGALVEIMNHAQTRNVERGITGILCYGSGQFLQALEGERTAVNVLYHRIVADARHLDCQLVDVSEISARAFPEWTMKVVNWETGDSARRRAMLRADTGSDFFQPSAMDAAQATTFLTHLADLERELAAD
jgi:hypothetical protein